MKRYSKEIGFILSAVVFCVICAVIIVISLKNDEKPSTTVDSYDYVYNDVTEIVPETKVYDDIISDPIVEGMPNGISYRQVTSRIIINTENASRVVFNYPTFSGISTQEDDSLNYLIKYQLEKMCRNTGEGMYKLASRGAKVVYEVTDFYIGYFDGSFFSIMFEGYYSVDSVDEHIDTGAHNFKYSMNIDLRKMELVSSEQLLSDYYLLRKRLTEGKLSLRFGEKDLLLNTNFGDMLSQYSDKYQIYPDLFFDSDSVNIIISLTADLGGSAVFSDKKAEAKVYINTYLAALSDYYT